MKSDSKKMMGQMGKGSFFVVMLTALCFLLTLAGCSNIVENPGTGKPNPPEDGSSLVAVTGEICLSGAFPGALQRGSGTQRTAIPTVGTVTYTVTAQNKADPEEKVTAQVQDDYSYTLYLSLGSWIISCSGVNDSGGQIIREKTPIELTVTQGESIPVPGALELFLIQTPGEGGSGAVSLNGAINFVKDSSAMVAVDITLTPWESSVTVPDIPRQTITGNGNFTVTLDAVPSGAYMMTLVFSVDGVAVSTVEEAVNVFDNMTTDTWYFGGGNSDHLTPQEDGCAVFNLTRYRTEFFIDGTGGEDTNPGSALKPLKTVGKAFSVLGKIKGADTAKITLQSDAGDTAGVTVPEGVNAVIFGEQAATVPIQITVGDGATVKVGTNVTCSGGAMVQNGGSLTLTQGGTIDGAALFSGIKDGNGGAVYVDGGTFTMNGGTVTGGNITGNGGGVYVNGGTFSMNGGTVTGGQAQYGGGVYIEGGTFTMKSGSSITGSSAGYGGGVYVKSGIFNMNDGADISRNTVTKDGGGVHMGDGTFTMSNGAIISGNSAASGGGVYVYNKGTFVMSGGTISGNKATDSGARGGGVCVYSGGVFTMSGGIIGGSDSGSANTSNFSGGGVYVYHTNFGFGAGTFDMSGGTIMGNKAVGSAAGGGGVCVSGAFSMSKNAIIQANSADSTGGGVYVTVAGATFTMSGGTISGNSSNFSTGGGVYVVDGCTFTMSGTATIKGNTASSGGGVYVDGTFTVSGSPTITGNTVSNNANNVYLPGGKTITIGADGLTNGPIGVTAEDMKAGGAAQITDTDVTGAADIFTSDISSYNVEETIATTDGGIAVFLSDAEVSYQKSSALARSLGALSDAVSEANTWNDGGTITLMKDIDGNNAVFSTGPITFSGGTTASPIILNLKGKTINRGLETSTSDGMVIKISGGSLTIQDSSSGGKITGGYTNKDLTGSGIHIDSGSVIMTGGEISGNGKDSSLKGGGVFIKNGGAFRMQGGSIADNQASNGGGVYLNGGTFTITGGSINGNKANNDGGGVYMNSGTFTINGGSINGNTAGQNGGGVYLLGGKVTIDSHGGSINGNTASQNGGGIYFSGGDFIIGKERKEDASQNDYILFEIKNNDGSGIENNLYVKDGAPLIQVYTQLGRFNNDGSVRDGEQSIGISMETKGNFAIKKADPNDGWPYWDIVQHFFFSDLDKDNEWVPDFTYPYWQL